MSFMACPEALSDWGVEEQYALDEIRRRYGQPMRRIVRGLARRVKSIKLM